VFSVMLKGGPGVLARYRLPLGTPGREGSGPFLRSRHHLRTGRQFTVSHFGPSKRSMLVQSSHRIDLNRARHWRDRGFFSIFSASAGGQRDLTFHFSTVSTWHCEFTAIRHFPQSHPSQSVVPATVLSHSGSSVSQTAGRSSSAVDQRLGWMRPAQRMHAMLNPEV